MIHARNTYHSFLDPLSICRAAHQCATGGAPRDDMDGRKIYRNPGECKRELLNNQYDELQLINY